MGWRIAACLNGPLLWMTELPDSAVSLKNSRSRPLPQKRCRAHGLTCKHQTSVGAVSTVRVPALTPVGAVLTANGSIASGEYSGAGPSMDTVRRRCCIEAEAYGLEDRRMSGRTSDVDD